LLGSATRKFFSSIGLEPPAPELTTDGKKYFQRVGALAFFDRLLTRLLIHQPDAPLPFCRAFVRDALADRPSKPEDEYRPRLEADSAYVRDHHVVPLVSDWVEALLRDQPPDFLQYSAQWLDRYPGLSSAGWP